MRVGFAGSTLVVHVPRPAGHGGAHMDRAAAAETAATVAAVTDAGGDDVEIDEVAWDGREAGRVDGAEQVHICNAQGACLHEME